jgi:hypothetical protein
MAESAMKIAVICAAHSARSGTRDAGLRFLHCALRLLSCAKRTPAVGLPLSFGATRPKQKQVFSWEKPVFPSRRKSQS